MAGRKPTPVLICGERDKCKRALGKMLKEAVEDDRSANRTAPRRISQLQWQTCRSGDVVFVTDYTLGPTPAAAAVRNANVCSVGKVET